MTQQLDLFNPMHRPEFLAWLVSPPGTPAPVFIRQIAKAGRK